MVFCPEKNTFLPLAHQGFPALAIRFFPSFVISSRSNAFFFQRPARLWHGVFVQVKPQGSPAWKGGISVVDMVDSSHIKLASGSFVVAISILHPVKPLCFTTRARTISGAPESFITPL